MIDETLGNYRIVSLIGEGGMGVVYRAEHTLLGRKAAVKVLRSQISEDLVSRFFNEARAAAMLHHPSCVDVFDFGHRPDGSAYIIMELLEGEPLSARLERETRMQIASASAIGRQVASALHVAHKQGIVHRDLKPGNIYLVPDNEAPAGVRAKVLDFGIAKLVRDPVPRSVRTNSGAVFGTPRYMSPEQCRNARDVDGRADVYSLGCILYEMLLGVAPFDYDSWGELVGAHLHETPPRPTELDKKLPADVELVLLTSLAKRPDDRYQTMQEFAQAIESLWRAHGKTSRTITFTPPAGIRAVATDDTLPPPSGSSPGIPLPENRPSQPRIAVGDKSTSVDDATQPPTPLPPVRRGTAVADTEPPPHTPPRGTEAVVAPLVPREHTLSTRRLPIVWIAGGALLLVVGGVVIWTLAKKSSGSGKDEVIYVERESTKVPPPPPPAPGDAAVASDEAHPDAAVTRTPTGKHPKVNPNETDTVALTRTFGRRTPAVQTCFQSHPQAIAEAVSIRIKIDLDGKVSAAEVLPASLAATPLGKCLEEVARGTVFGAQPKPATFRVPIHVGK